MKLNLGAGKDIKPGYVNHDLAQLPKIDVVHDLNQLPWPWDENSFEEIMAVDILEHLDNFVKAMEEINRILKPGGIALIRVPYWNHSCAYIDPTHRRGFHELSFHFFSVNSKYFGERDYYSNARFELVDEALILVPGYPYFSIRGARMIHVRNRVLRKLIGCIGNHIANVIADVQVVLKKVE